VEEREKVLRDRKCVERQRGLMFLWMEKGVMQRSREGERGVGHGEEHVHVRAFRRGKGRVVQVQSELRDWLLAPGPWVPVQSPINRDRLAPLLSALLSDVACKAKDSTAAVHSGTASGGGEVSNGDVPPVAGSTVERLLLLLDHLRRLLRQWTSLKDAACEIEICILAALPPVPYFFSPKFFSQRLEFANGNSCGNCEVKSCVHCVKSFMWKLCSQLMCKLCQFIHV
jgi:hypothetical protein